MKKNIKRIIFTLLIFLSIVNISNVSAAKTLNGRTLDELNTKIKRELIDNGCPEAKANVRISEAKGATVEWENTSQNKHYKAIISNSVGSAAAAMGYQATITIEQTEIKSGGSTSGGSTSGGSTSGGSTSGGSTSGGSTSGGSTSGGSTSGSSTSENKSSQIYGNSLDDLNTKIKRELINRGCPEAKANVRISAAKGATVEWENTSQNKHYKAIISNAVGSEAAAMGYRATITIEQTEIKSGGSTSGGSTSGNTTSDGASSDSTRPNRAPIQTPSREEDDKTEYTPGEIVDGAQGFINIGENNGGNNKIAQDNMEKLSDTIYNILLVIGIVVALIVGLILGIKLVLGSLEEKAEIKTMLIPYIIGCIVVFGAFAIWKIVVDILQSV